MEASPAMETLAEDSTFIVSGSFVRTSGGISGLCFVGDTVYEGVFTKLVTAYHGRLRGI
jgi:hypothetical protein